VIAMQCVLTISLLAPEAKDTVTAALINNHYVILRTYSEDDEGNFFPTSRVASNEDTIGAVYSALLDIEDDEELGEVYPEDVRDYVKTIDVRHFGITVSAIGECSFTTAAGNVERVTNELNEFENE